MPTGRVAFNVRNFGEDGHDLAVRTASGRVLGALGEISPARPARLSVRLRKPGRYRIFCSLAGHEARGMRALLRVKRASVALEQPGVRVADAALLDAEVSVARR